MREISLEQAAVFAGITERQFYRYLASDHPPRREPNGKFRLDRLGQWLREHVRRKAERRIPTEPDARYQAVRKIKEMADRYALENTARRAELVEVSELEAAWTDICERIQLPVLEIAPTVAPLLAAEADPAKCQDVLDSHIRSALEELAG